MTNTRDTREEGKGFRRVAEGLPGPVPVCTLPATRAGLPYPCGCLSPIMTPIHPRPSFHGAQQGLGRAHQVFVIAVRKARAVGSKTT